ESVGIFPAGALAFRIELQNFPKCAQYQQALAVATLNKEKTDKATHPLRNLYLGLKGKRRAKDVTPDAIAKYIEEMKPKVEELDKLSAEYDQKIYDLAQPKAR